MLNKFWLFLLGFFLLIGLSLCTLKTEYDHNLDEALIGTWKINTSDTVIKFTGDTFIINDTIIGKYIKNSIPDLKFLWVWENTNYPISYHWMLDTIENNFYYISSSSDCSLFTIYGLYLFKTDTIKLNWLHE